MERDGRSKKSHHQTDPENMPSASELPFLPPFLGIIANLTHLVYGVAEIL